jgi:hypothetical protein
LRTAQSLWPTTNWRGHLASGPSPPPWGRRPGGERERRITTGSAVDPLVSRLFDRSGGTARGRAGERSRLARECPRAGGRYGRLLGLALPARSRTSSRASPRRPLAPGPALSKPQRRSPRQSRSSPADQRACSPAGHGRTRATSDERRDHSLHRAGSWKQKPATVGATLPKRTSSISSAHEAKVQRQALTFIRRPLSL